MHRKILLIILPLFLLSFALLNSQIQAQDTQVDDVPPGFLGQDHYYSVTLRGNGEAVVTLKAIFTNTSDEDLDTVKLRVPAVEPEDISIYQVIRQSFPCRSYPQDEGPLPGPTLLPQISDQSAQSGDEAVGYSEKYCRDYGLADYYQPYWPGKTRYKKAKFEVDADTIIITLPEAIKPDASASYLLYFRAFGYAKKNLFGVWKYTFESLKVDDVIRNLSIGVDTDSDLYLKGAKGKVDYRLEEGMSALKSAPMAEGGLVSPRFDTFYNQIGQGTIQKKASDLQPLDSYTVQGSFTDSRVKLYAGELFWGIVLAAFIGCALFFLVKFFLRFLPSHFSSLLLLMAGTSFISSILIVLYTVVVFTVIQYLAYSGFSQLLLVILMPFSLVVYSLLVFAPALFLGVKKGWSWGIGTLVATILFLGFYLFIFIVFISFFAYKFPRPSPIPIMRQMMEGVSR